jgi:hypothetical protein
MDMIDVIEVQANEREEFHQNRALQEPIDYHHYRLTLKESYMREIFLKTYRKTSFKENKQGNLL